MKAIYVSASEYESVSKKLKTAYQSIISLEEVIHTNTIELNALREELALERCKAISRAEFIAESIKGDNND